MNKKINLKAKTKQMKNKKQEKEEVEKDEVYEVEEILDFNTKEDMYLVRWKNYPPKHDSWEPYCNLNCNEKLLDYHKKSSANNNSSTPTTSARCSSSTDENQRRGGRGGRGGGNANLVASISSGSVNNGGSIHSDDTERSEQRDEKVEERVMYEENHQENLHSKDGIARKRKNSNAPRKRSNDKLRKMAQKEAGVSYLSDKERSLVKIHYQHEHMGNLLTINGVEKLVTHLNRAEADKDCKFVIFYTSGKIFCSGFDNLTIKKENPRKNAAGRSANAIRRFVSCLIKFPKILIAQVQGPAFGLGFGMLAYFDFVYAMEDATFSVPYLKMKQGTEACVACTFPKLFGKATTNELLYYGSILTAHKAERLGFVEVLNTDHTSFGAHILHKCADLYREDSERLIQMKKTMNMTLDQDELLAYLDRETTALRTSWTNEAFYEQNQVALVMYLMPDSMRRQYATSNVVSREICDVLGLHPLLSSLRVDLQASRDETC